MKPRVSILLPVFNAEATLSECLDSLLTQTYSDFEILATDDGSYDATADILIDYVKKDSRLKMINSEHSGIVSSLTTAFAHSQATYIARMDADDISVPTRLEKQVAFLDEHSDIAIVGSKVGSIPGETLGGGYKEYFKWINDLIDPEQIAMNIFVESPIPHPSVMFRRQPYEMAGGYQDHKWPEDYGLWLRMHLMGYKFAKVPEVLLYWRDHPNRATRNNPRYDADAFFRAKAYYLAQGPLKNVKEVVAWGAGKTSKQRSAYLKEYGIKIAAYIDVDPNKIGNKIQGVPIIDPTRLSDYPHHLILSFVGNRGAREDIRRMLAEMGKIEGKDFIACA